MTRPLFALAALVVVAGSVRAADDVLPGPEIKWPEVKGLDRQKPKVFDDKKLGYSIAYLGDGTIVTVFVYNLGLEKIPGDPYSDVIKAEMYESMLALEANKTNPKPRYKSISPLDEKVMPLGSNKGAVQIRRKRYEVEIIDEGQAVTELYLTGYKNYFIKIRATYPAEGKEKSQKNLSNLLDALGNELK
jgi:hypothetical protein